MPSIFAKGNCIKQDERAEKISKLCSKYDFCILQEQWGCQVEIFQKNLQETHRVPDSNWSSFPIGGTLFELWNVATNYLSETGGLYIPYKKEFQLILESRKTFEHSETKSKKGVQLILLDISSSTLKCDYLVLVSTHLDPYNINHSQENQLKEIELFLKEELTKIVNKYGKQKISIILSGDFNIDSIKEFNYFTKDCPILTSRRDLYFEFCESNSLDMEVTCIERDSNMNFSYNQSNEYVYSGRIDYSFSFDSISLDNVIYDLERIKCSKVKVLSELYDISDHFGTEIEFKFL
eukprot:gene2171-2035_t